MASPARQAVQGLSFIFPLPQTTERFNYHLNFVTFNFFSKVWRVASEKLTPPVRLTHLS